MSHIFCPQTHLIADDDALSALIKLILKQAWGKESDQQKMTEIYVTKYFKKFNTK